MERIIFHIDVNNAFLSWSACDMLKKGASVDIREIASIIGGDEKQRKGIVLAKSEVAKKFGIKTAETIYQARQKCNNLKIFPPDFRIYIFFYSIHKLVVFFFIFLDIKRYFGNIRIISSYTF